MQLVERNFSSAQVAAAAVCPWGNLSFGYQTIIFREFLCLSSLDSDSSFLKRNKILYFS
jgi:hypothetical protein